VIGRMMLSRHCHRALTMGAAPPAGAGGKVSVIRAATSLLHQSGARQCSKIDYPSAAEESITRRLSRPKSQSGMAIRTKVILI
jgi:hypothetical protein